MLTRREFFWVGASAAGGLLVRFHLSNGYLLGAEKGTSPGASLNAYVEIGAEGYVTIACPVQEIGQGVRTSLPMIVAEELDVDWPQVRVVQPAADPKYGAMSVGGSDSVADYWEPLRHAGATARTMLVEAAARVWSVSAGECRTEKGEVVHVPSGRRLGYGRLAEAASQLPVPEDIDLKDPAEFQIIGTPVDRVDTSEIVTGTAVFGFDVHVEGMLYASIVRPPAKGAKVKRVDAAKARVVPGVRDVFEIDPLTIPTYLYGSTKGGVVVLADSTWAALKGRSSLQVHWDDGPNGRFGSADIAERLRTAAIGAGEIVLRDDGDVESGLGAAARKLEAFYELPILAHACMEPLTFTADVREDRCETWGATQDPRGVQDLLSGLLRIPKEKVKVNLTLEGGGFGRRLAVDYAVEAALISRRAKMPVRVFWSREDATRHDFYRTPSRHRLRAGLGENGEVIAWRHHVVAASLRRHSMGEEADHPELYDVEGAVNLPYQLKNVLVEFTPVNIPLQMGSWRSVSHSFNVFAVNGFVDEIAAAANKDPLQMQLELLGPSREVTLQLPMPGRRGRPSWHTGRLRRVLEAAAKKASWGSKLPEGHGRGVACCYFKRTYMAHVAEVSVSARGEVRVHRIVAAIDCGRVINPDGVRAQVEGAAIDGVATVLKWQITMENGRVRQGNFDDYPLLRMDETPEVEVHIIPSSESPSGTGEPPYPSVAPAVVNAIFAATGKRLRRLPVRPEDLRT